MYQRPISIRTVMKILAVVCLATPLVVQAGVLDSLFKKGDDDAPQRARYDLEPPLVFDAGELAIDLTGRWKLGGSSLTFDEDSIVIRGGRESESHSLYMGQEARMVGHRLASGVVLVHRLTLIAQRGSTTKLGALEAGTAMVGEMAADAPK